MTWLKLTEVDGVAVHVNMDHVIRFSAAKPVGSALLTTADRKDGTPIAIRVRESPDQIHELMRGARLPPA